ncbi:MAG: bifunctional oligoribonuclease/PAP phosphatase NrnA [Oscillospiraceae bacterium]|nr:bifunctional oligoribonuclease/PAP phosphatase NrnA [Oscillospiraceae bacterium]MBQ2158064.1 bifunctional oligoribonuclease/PAP phosphatase NrnA [Oscillospiraceae bacterium]
MNEVSVKEAANLLSLNNNFIILTHKRPDGDTLGCGAALCSALRRAGKRAYLLRNGGATEKFVPFIERFYTRRGFQITNEYVVTVDVASSNMLGDRLQLNVDLAIDHHESNSRFANNLLLDASASACGEIILKVIKELCGSVSKEEADLLYIALSTDTGCFQYGNTNAASFRAAAELCELNADVAKLNQLFFRTFSRGRIALEGAIMSSLRSYADGRITMAVITHKMVEEAGASDDDMEDLASLPGKVAGTLVSVMVKENDRGFSKLSLRSTGEVNVSEICAKFGGGGHAMASGCELDLVPDEAAEVIRAAIEEKLP